MSEAVLEELTESCCFELIRNRNEGRVRKAMEELFTIVDASMLSEKDCCDIYAFSLNALPARYVQKGTIVLREPVREKTVNKTVYAAYKRVLANPKR